MSLTKVVGVAAISLASLSGCMSERYRHADFDKDGAKELIYANNDRNMIIMQRPGKAKKVILDAISFDDFHVADVDGDGFPDEYTSGYIKATLYNDRKGNFSTPQF